MAYDERLAERVRTLLRHKHRVSERKMFGGLAFMVRGHMCCGIVGGDLMARVGPARYDEALAWPGARPMDFTGKPVAGFVYVGPSGVKRTTQLRRCIDAALDFARQLPAKPARRGRGTARQRRVPRGPHRP